MLECFFFLFLLIRWQSTGGRFEAKLERRLRERVELGPFKAGATSGSPYNVTVPNVSLNKKIKKAELGLSAQMLRGYFCLIRAQQNWKKNFLLIGGLPLFGLTGDEG